jgi:uncharacterized protein YjdB
MASRVKMLPVLFACIVLTCASPLLAQANVRSLTNVTVTITPTKTTLFAGDVYTLVATVVGIDDKTVTWVVEEDDGGTITDSGRYTAPKIEGMYHITATSRGSPQTKAVVTITVLAYCDPTPRALR